MTRYTSTYDVPTEGVLTVRIGDQVREANPDDLVKFGLMPTVDAVSNFDDAVREGLRDFLPEGESAEATLRLRPVTRVAEVAIRFAHLPAIREDESHVDTLRTVAAIEAALRLLAEGKDSEAGELYRVRLAEQEA